MTPESESVSTDRPSASAEPGPGAPGGVTKMSGAVDLEGKTPMGGGRMTANALLPPSAVHPGDTQQEPKP